MRFCIKGIVINDNYEFEQVTEIDIHRRELDLVIYSTQKTFENKSFNLQIYVIQS